MSAFSCRLAWRSTRETLTMIKPGILLQLFIAATFCLGFCAADEAELYKALFEDQDYKKHVRPRANANDIVEVTLEFELHTINDLDEVNQVLYSVGFLVAEWHDDYLTWNPASHAGIETLIVPPTTVWLPDLGIENSADTFYHDSFAKDFRVRIEYTGKVIWSFGGGFATLCSLDMTYYPFDKQTCELRVENWAYNGHQVSLTNKTDHVPKAHYEEQGIWDFVGSGVEYVDIYYDIYPGIPFPELKFQLLLKRKPNYYMLNIVTPCIMIIIIALSVFWMPPDAGEKVSLGITVLLAFSVFQIIIADNTPKNSDYSPVLSVLVLCTMCLATISVLSSIAVLYLHHHHTKTRPPLFLRRVFFRFGAKILCMRSWVPEYGKVGFMENQSDGGNDGAMVVENIENVDEKKSAPKSQDAGNTTEQDILFHLRKITGKIKDDSENGTIMEEWKGIAIVLDRFLFWLSLLFIIILCLGIFTQSDPDH